MRKSKKLFSTREPNGSLGHEKNTTCAKGAFGALRLESACGAARVAVMNAFQTTGNEANPDALSAIVRASETYSIIASQDIVDARGIKLWAKGQPVSAALQQRLLDRTLQRPLEACLAVEDGVSLVRLKDDLKAYLDDDTPLTAALRPWAPELLEQVKQLPLHSVAQLVLTAAVATRPHTLPHAVAAMALAGAMASGQRSVVDVRLAMLGGLLHDIGEMYIQPQYLDYAGPLDLLGHKHLLVHPRVAQRLLSTTTDYPESLCRAIGEHHERLDGSGYPARLATDNISPLGRMLAVVDVTLGIHARAPVAPLTRACFALRVVPGEFDPRWSNLICSVARTVGETLPAEAAQAHPLQSLQLVQIDQRMQQAQQLGAMLKQQSRVGTSMEIVEAAQYRLSRLRVAWYALGFWGLDAGTELSPVERFELQMAANELQWRLRQLQRECLLMAERLGESDKARLAPLWQGLLEDRVG